MHGKEKCKILKEIRQQIAENNDIEYAVSECKHQGNCKGTCPKCESELCYLENELEKRRMNGKKIILAGISAAILAVNTACTDPISSNKLNESSELKDNGTIKTDTEGTKEFKPGTDEEYNTETAGGLIETCVETEEGEFAETGDYCDTLEGEVEIVGDIPIETLEGDIAYTETETEEMLLFTDNTDGQE